MVKSVGVTCCGLSTDFLELSSQGFFFCLCVLTKCKCDEFVCLFFYVFYSDKTSVSIFWYSNQK